MIRWLKMLPTLKAIIGWTVQITDILKPEGNVLFKSHEGL